MAHPKHRVSKQRKRKRRTHQKAAVPQLAVCKKTGETHVYHHAYFDDEGNMYYRGHLLVKAVEDED